jgi:hypothetical protein
LCVVNLLCSAVEALAKFECKGTDRECFVQFVENYFGDEVRQVNLNLYDPDPYLKSIT